MNDQYNVINNDYGEFLKLSRMDEHVFLIDRVSFYSNFLINFGNGDIDTVVVDKQQPRGQNPDDSFPYIASFCYNQTNCLIVDFDKYDSLESEVESRNIFYPSGIQNYDPIIFKLVK